MPWLDSFKLALIQEDESALLCLIDTLPPFETEDQMHTALSFLTQAQSLFEKKKSEYKTEMLKINKTKKYLEASI